MGWTWRARKQLLIQYPELANVQELMDRWPSLAEFANEMKISGELPKVLDESDPDVADEKDVK